MPVGNKSTVFNVSVSNLVTEANKNIKNTFPISIRLSFQTNMRYIRTACAKLKYFVDS